MSEFDYLIDGGGEEHLPVVSPATSGDSSLSERDESRLENEVALGRDLFAGVEGPEPPRRQRVLAPLYGDALRDAANTGYAYPRLLQETWGDEVFMGSAFARAWEYEFGHQEAPLLPDPKDPGKR